MDLTNFVEPYGYRAIPRISPQQSNARSQSKECSNSTSTSSIQRPWHCVLKKALKDSPGLTTRLRQLQLLAAFSLMAQPPPPAPGEYVLPMEYQEREPLARWLR